MQLEINKENLKNFSNKSFIRKMWHWKFLQLSLLLFQMLLLIISRELGQILTYHFLSSFWWTAATKLADTCYWVSEAAQDLDTKVIDGST